MSALCAGSFTVMSARKVPWRVHAVGGERTCQIGRVRRRRGRRARKGPLLREGRERTLDNHAGHVDGVEEVGHPRRLPLLAMFSVLLPDVLPVQHDPATACAAPAHRGLSRSRGEKKQRAAGVVVVRHTHTHTHTHTDTQTLSHTEGRGVRDTHTRTHTHTLTHP